MAIERFEIPFSEAALRDLHERLARTRWPDEIPGSGWDYGFPLGYLREICRYWKDEFDWKARISRFARSHHYRCTVQGVGIHFIHQRAKSSSAMPLVITHGWPGSFLEMLKILPLLSDSFDVVIPSLPGFGFSDQAAQPGMSSFRIADLWAELMTELGYGRFAVQGGDFGASVSTILGLRHAERIIGMHLNYIPGSYRPYLAPDAKLSPVEQAYLSEAVRWYEDWGAYAHLQRNEPLTAAYGLSDSPAALAAWIIGKFRDWADCDGDVERSFTKDELLTNVTLYWMTQTVHSSFRLYYETKKSPLRFQSGELVRVPCAIARFPKEAPFPPRQWIERSYNIERWTDMPRGGHFAAAEEPELLAADMQAFFGGLRA
jgi:pimeloyl-ACP methyl ester carboxylesterase